MRKHYLELLRNPRNKAMLAFGVAESYRGPPVSYRRLADRLYAVVTEALDSEDAELKAAATAVCDLAMKMVAQQLAN